MRKTLLLSLLCTTLLSTPVLAGLQEGLDFFEQKKYPQAMEEFTYLADEGNNIAAYHLGVIYEEGLGVEKSMPKAAQYYLQSYNAGNPNAASKLGRLLIAGDGVTQDLDAGLNMLKNAARSGDKEALYQLGETYASGDFVTRDYTNAGGFYKMAALRGYAPAQYKLGLLYFYGRGVPQDYPLAVRWLSRSSNQGYVQAQQVLAETLSTEKRLYNPIEAYAWYSIIAAYNTDEVGVWAAHRRDEIAGKIKDAKNLKIAQQMARNWRIKEGALSVPENELTEPTPIIVGFNDVDTLRILQEQNVTVLSDGTRFGIRSEELENAILSKDTAGIEAKLSEFGKNGRPEAFTFWAKILENRMQNPTEAFKWFTQGANYGDPEAQYNVAQDYCAGKNANVDIQTCYMWLQIAAKKAVSPLKEAVTNAIVTLEGQASAEQLAEGKKRADAWTPTTDKQSTGFKLF